MTIPEEASEDREPDELDALLKRTESGAADNDGENTRLDNSTTTSSSSHRKSYSIGVGSSMHAMRPSHRQRIPRHRKNKSSISELMAGAFTSGNLGPIREDLQETVDSLRKEFVHGLDVMDRGETGNFDMGLLRSLSVLPDNVYELANEVGIEEEDAEGRVPIIQYLLLLSAVAAISSNSTALHMLDGVAPPMKLFWRMTSSYIVLSPLALHFLVKDGVPQLSLGGWMTFIAAILCFSAQNCLFYSSLQLTTIGNAVIYANSQALLLIIGKAFVGEPIHLFEGFGVIIAFSGAMLCSKDSEASSEAADRSDAIFGDLMALTSAICGVAYLTFAKAVRSEMSVTVFIVYVMFFGSFSVLIFIATSTEEGFEWNTNPYNGVFGGFSLFHGRIFVLLYLAVICNCIGTMGFVRSMEYFDNVIIAVATLMEPLLASLIAFVFHAGLLPGTLGWIGNALVVVGTLAVVYPSMGKGNSSMH